MTNSIGKKRRGSAEVASAIRDSILNEMLQIHERLPSERLLSETYGVSRGTIRDALNQLSDQGYVEIRPGSGTYVIFNDRTNGARIIADARPLELIDTRFALEPHICRLVVLHGQEADLNKLEALIQRMESNTNNTKAFAEADTAFHAALAEATGNTLLIWIISQINDVRSQSKWSRMRKATLNHQIIQTYNTQHRLILDAIKKRDPELAATSMKDHLETARRSLMRAAEA